MIYGKERNQKQIFLKDNAKKITSLITTISMTVGKSVMSTRKKMEGAEHPQSLTFLLLQILNE